MSDSRGWVCESSFENSLGQQQEFVLRDRACFVGSCTSILHAGILKYASKHDCRHHPIESCSDTEKAAKSYTSNGVGQVITMGSQKVVRPSDLTYLNGDTAD